MNMNQIINYQDDDEHLEYGEEEEEEEYSMSKKVVEISQQYCVDEIIKEVDEGTISPPMNYDQWKERRLHRIEEFSKILSSNQSQSIDEGMFSQRKKEQAPRYAISSQKREEDGSNESEA